MYDTNLNELYGKVIKLRPKLNKSLRNSIEKYETFLEMNNKISTITRLYDQFLEQKLNMAYGNHNIFSFTTTTGRSIHWSSNNNNSNNNLIFQLKVLVILVMVDLIPM